MRERQPAVRLIQTGAAPTTPTDVRGPPVFSLSSSRNSYNQRRHPSHTSNCQLTVFPVASHPHPFHAPFELTAVIVSYQHLAPVSTPSLPCPLSLMQSPSPCLRHDER